MSLAEKPLFKKIFKLQTNIEDSHIRISLLKTLVYLKLVFI